MKIFKKLSALILVCLLALSATACHKQNEVAVTVDGFEFTSAYYMCALINAKLEAQNTVYSNLSEEEQSEEIDYYSQKVDDKDFVTWVEDRAIEIITEIGTYKSLCDKNELELDEETVANAEYYASYYWSYGYSEYFEPNGVSEKTYTQYTVDACYADLYFDFVYGEGGEKEISAEDVTNKYYDNFLVADILEVTFSEETDDEKNAIKSQLDTYLTALTKKTMTFEEVYNDYNQVEETEQTEDTEEEAPLDKYASVIGAEGTGYEHDYYDDIKAMATGEVKLIEQADSAGYLLVVKKDVKEDPYYLKQLDSTLRHLIKDDEFKEDIAAVAKDMKTEISEYAIGQFKVKKIIEPSYS